VSDLQGAGGERPGEQAAGHGQQFRVGRRARLARLERLLDHEEALRQPEWLRPSEGEPLWPVALAVVTAVVLQWSVPQRLAIHPTWLMPALVMALFIVLSAATKSVESRRGSIWVRVAGLVLVVVAALANGYSAVRLLLELIHGKATLDAESLLGTGGAIYLTNIIVFALWYWEYDRGGPQARAIGKEIVPDFLFPQMADPELDPTWHPEFGDYFYLAFTNATAFSPTDTMPLSRWAKMTMVLQSSVSLVLIGLVIAHVVNILR
jgi:hypothetical protein